MSASSDQHLISNLADFGFTHVIDAFLALSTNNPNRNLLRKEAYLSNERTNLQPSGIKHRNIQINEAQAVA